LTWKDQPFSWGVEAENAFQFLKVSFTIPPLLIHVNLSKPFVLEMDAFDFALGTILSQPGENNLLLTIEFYFHKFSPVEINHDIHDKKILAIMDAFEKWHHLLERAQHEITVYYDHKNFQYFMMACVLKWALSLFQFRFVITYHPRRQQGKLDALSHRSYLVPKEGDAAYD